MATLTITRGLPGSGKTAWARQQPGWRVNRDDLRAMLRPNWLHGDNSYEDVCTQVQHAAIRALLNVGLDVIVDDTNLHPAHVDALRRLASYADGEFVIQDFTDVPLEVCIDRDAARSNAAGADVIRRMWEKHLAPEAADKAHPGWRDEPGRLIPPMRLDDLKALCAASNTAPSKDSTAHEDADPGMPAAWCGDPDHNDPCNNCDQTLTDASEALRQRTPTAQ